ncbi:MAG TPA: hypothetical protein VGJ55_15595 [Pyrinomonadaceae bacterium]
MKERPTYFAPSALGILDVLYLGRWPRLLHFAPLALLVVRRTIYSQPNCITAFTDEAF